MPTGTFRAIGPQDGILPEPTGMVLGYFRDPNKSPYLRYCQMVPAPEIQFRYAELDPDEPVRLVELNSYAWGYDDYRPSGRGFTFKARWIDDSVQRWDFPYQVGEHTVRVWQKSGINTRMLFDQVRSNHARLHRSVRIVNALTAANWGSNTGTLASLGIIPAGGFWDLSSGTQYLADGTPNPQFQIIKKTFQKIHRRVNLATNSAVTGEELICVMPPTVAEAVATSGEMVEFLKQSQYAKPDLTQLNWATWGLPDMYGGIGLVVEDTPRCFINQHDDGTVANVLVPAQKDYIMTGDTVYFVSRVGGLTGTYGTRNWSTVQLYHFGGEVRVRAFSEPKHELVEGHVEMEDKALVPSTISGFKLTDVLST